MMKKVMTMLILALGFVAPGLGQGAEEVKEVLASITQQMKDLTSVQVDFVEEKKMAIFSSPIILHGAISWEHPDSFAWRIVSPIQYSMVMRQGNVRQWEGENNTVQDFNLNSNPILRVASQQLQRWFSGNYKQLAVEYEVTVVSRLPLILKCVPHKDSPESGFISSVSIQFRKDLRYINKITIEEASGDVTNIRFENSRLNEAIPADVWRAGPVKPHV